MERSLDPFHAGDRVQWRWGAHMAEGKVSEVFTERVERTIKGARIVRNGEIDNPAYLITQENGAQVLKRHSEVFRAPGRR
jgi:hypothetical protein